MSKSFQNQAGPGSAVPAAQAQLIAQTLFQQASAFHQKGQFDQAQSLYESLLRIQPRHSEGLQAFGYLAYQTNQFEMAIHWLSKAVEANPKSAKLHLTLALSYRALHRFEEALISYDKAIALEPKSVEAHNNRGETLRHLTKLDEALASYDLAIAINPDYAPAHNGRGRTLADTKQYEDALASFDHALALKPDYAEAHSNRGEVLNTLGRFEQALASIDCALALEPNYSETFYNRGNSLQQFRKLDEALANYDKAIALKPYYPEAYYQRGKVLQQLNRLDDALLSYEKAVALKPDHTAACECRDHLLAVLEPTQSAEHSQYPVTTPSRVHKIAIPPGFERHYSAYQHTPSRFADAHIITIDGHAIRVCERLIEPEIVVFENLLSDAECELLIDLSRPKLKPSPTFDRDNTTGKGKLSTERTSEGAGFLRAENTLVRNIEMRLAKLMNLPFENGEEINILHYITGAEYRPHYDFFAPEDKSSAAFLQQAGQRVATLIMYLNDVERGGETIFPGIEFSVAPRKGGGVFFSYCDANGKLDRLSLHGGAPVAQGEKWIATKWVRQRGYKA